jgi:DNA polymerase I-like protein with 3'-5' exonuclease and polymerase domains
MCPGLDAIPGATDQVAKIKEYLTIRNRRNVLASDSGSGWLNHTRVQREGLIGSDADTVGAVTGRFTHRVIANIPRASSAYGKEIRGLFTARNGYVMVGWDASSLEARMEAHYTYPIDGGAYGNELLEGDIHTKNQLALGLPTRAQAKTFKYAVTYGASANKLASQFGWSKSHAEDVYQAFWEANPALKELHRRVQVAAERGYLVAIDRRRIPVDSMHSALNRLLQSAGAITMKYAMVIADKTIKEWCLDAYGLIRYHDEEQWEAKESDADFVGRLGIQSIVSAGEMLKLNVPLTGEYNIGKNWSETH